jgi:hypothetical protein
MESIFWGSGGVKASCADAAPGNMAMTIARADFHIDAIPSSRQPKASAVKRIARG